MRGVRSGGSERDARRLSGNPSSQLHLDCSCSSAHDDMVIGCITFYSTATTTAISLVQVSPAGSSVALVVLREVGDAQGERTNGGSQDERNDRARPRHVR